MTALLTILLDTRLNENTTNPLRKHLTIKGYVKIFVKACMVTRCKGRLYCSFCINLIKSVVFAIKFAILLRISGNISMYLVNILILDLVWKVLLSSINPKYVTSTDDKVELKKV